MNQSSHSDRDAHGSNNGQDKDDPEPFPVARATGAIPTVVALFDHHPGGMNGILSHTHNVAFLRLETLGWNQFGFQNDLLCLHQVAGRRMSPAAVRGGKRGGLLLSSASPKGIAEGRGDFPQGPTTGAVGAARHGHGSRSLQWPPLILDIVLS